MNRFIDRVHHGMQGGNEGLPNGLVSLNQYIYGTQPSRYYLLGGESGTGKTTLADFMFLFAPYRFMKEKSALELEIEINWKYYSFEQGRRAKEDSWASKILMDTYQKRLPVAYLLSKGKNRVTQDEIHMLDTVQTELDQMFEHIDMVDVPITPTQFKMDLIRYGKKHGKWLVRPLLDVNGQPRKDGKGNPMSEIYGWVPNNPKAKHVFIMDHIAYAQQEMKSLKENIDAISRTCVFFREITNWTFVIIQQFNTELSSIERQKFKKNAIAPQRVDFGDSKYTYQDADVVFGMLNPYNYDITEFHEYDTLRLKGYAIFAFLMKNRHDGPASRVSPLFMDPVSGMFYELPIPLSETALEMGGEDPVARFYDMAIEFNESIKLYKS